MTKKKLNNTFPKFQLYIKDQQKNSNPIKFAAPMKTQAIVNHITQRREQPQTLLLKNTSNHLLLISLNTNELSSPIKRHRSTEWKRKQDPFISCIYETHLNFKGRQSLRIKYRKKNLQINQTKKYTGVAILTYEMDFSQKRQRIHHTTGKVYPYGVSILHFYDPNSRATTCIKVILLKCKLHIKPHTLLVDF